MTKIFLTGATGYIGGDALYALTSKYPSYSISALVRSPEKAEQVQAQYPSVRVVVGDLDDSALLEKESADADIVLHTADASDHVGAAKAIAAGLARGHSAANPGYWLHTSGTGILMFKDLDQNRFGEYDEKVYDDWENVDELLNLPDHAFHRNVDRLVLETAKREEGVVKTALVCPPTIYGRGRGPVSQRGRQVYQLAKATLQLQKGPIIGPGRSIWNNIHIHDLSDLYVLLVEAAVGGTGTRTGTETDDREIWGERAYYLTENGEHAWGELARATAKTAAELGLIPEAKAEEIGLEEAQKYGGGEAVTWGLNSRGRARRAAKVVGWVPSRPSLEASLVEVVEGEAARLK
ncbi:nucleoside-diphosphate-sugar epimerase [Aspergillus heteromorphus CBS 117.55]|uniref:Nucleoside-diphosphate-sugar epimerase n=1 Tax=Aspergillus heteromorphus CBS 117.55 TaxID=1448321 RepID=A0A317WVE6_9EURO|nr:nucleoside-diphosphate-sugar epimerase [Aspergillus heteromorphus CBS 117.55]PWY89197.1 nucleoside-diphosphate-sugar epimerase [Aspergillus heteromorphus CBS 117.55]